MKNKETWPGFILELLALAAMVLYDWYLGWPIGPGTLILGAVVVLIVVIAVAGEIASVSQRVRFVEIEQYGERLAKRQAAAAQAQQEWISENFGPDAGEAPSDEGDTFKRYGE